MRIIDINELNELGAGTVFAETHKDIDSYAEIEPTSSLMIRLSNSITYGKSKIFNGVVDILPHQDPSNYLGQGSQPETYSWDCASSDYNEDDKFILYEKKDLIVMRDLLNAAINSFETGKFEVDIDKLDAILQE